MMNRVVKLFLKGGFMLPQLIIEVLESYMPAITFHVKESSLLLLLNNPPLLLILDNSRG